MSYQMSRSLIMRSQSAPRTNRTNIYQAHERNECLESPCGTDLISFPEDNWNPDEGREVYPVAPEALELLRQQTQHRETLQYGRGMNEAQTAVEFGHTERILYNIELLKMSPSPRLMGFRDMIKILTEETGNVQQNKLAVVINEMQEKYATDSQNSQPAHP